MKKAGMYIACIMLCFSIMVQSITVPAKAFAFAVPAAYAAYISALMVAAGITMSSSAAIDTEVQNFYVSLDETELQLITGDWAASRIIKDVGTGLYKNVVAVAPALWEKVCNWVDGLFNPGETIDLGQTITGDTHGLVYPMTFQPSELPVNVFVQTSSYSCRYWIFAEDYDNNGIDNVCYLNFNADGSIGGSLNGGEGVLELINYNGALRIICGGIYRTAEAIGYVISITSNSVVNQNGTIYADPDLIDVSGRTWENTDTHDMHVVIPSEQAADGTYTTPYERYRDTLVGADQRAITDEDAIGVPITEDITFGDTLAEGKEAIAQSIGDGLKQFKRKSTDFKLAIGAFMVDLGNLYIWVPYDTRVLILAALAICMFAAVYKVIRG